MEKKRIIIDLDVVTVGKWDKSVNGDMARKFLNRVEKGEFRMITPYIIFELLSKWRYGKLVNEIREFYEFYSSEIITVLNLDERIKRVGLNRKEIAKDIQHYTVKEEDTILVIIASIFDTYYFVTFNRKHLKNKEVRINNVLQKYGIKTIRIVLPNEI